MPIPQAGSAAGHLVQQALDGFLGDFESFYAKVWLFFFFLKPILQEHLINSPQLRSP